jgi:hypothetical protein
MEIKSFTERFDEWYEANKESLTTKTTEAALREAFTSGFKDADSHVPAILTWALAMSKAYPVVMIENGDKYVAGVNTLYIEGETAIGCMAHVAATLLEAAGLDTDSLTTNSNLIIPGGMDV